MCTFCGTYKDQKFRIKDMKTIIRDIEEISRTGHRFKRAFLADGDVLILPTDQLISIIKMIRKLNPSVERIGVYGNTKAILKKSASELNELKSAGLGIVYQGIESGNIDVLRRIRKGASPHRMIEASRKITDAGIKLSQTVLLGIGGIDYSERHSVDTGRLIGEMSPDFAGALTVMLLPNTQLYRDWKNGDYSLPDKFSLLRELRLMIENIKCSRPCFFTSNHASNYVPIRAELPAEADEICRMLDKVIEKGDETLLKPEYMRAL
jgi:radical SAM superfamily enzyme YgiQ (UPF0313 family)